MSNEITTQGNSREEIELIKNTVAKGATDIELSFFLSYCQRTGLDPIARQIYMSDRRSKDHNGNWVTTRRPETTIDGFRLIAERTGKYKGQLGPFWCDDSGQWVDVWTKDTPPTAAKVGILRSDFTEPLWSVALYREYVQTTKDGQPNSMWRKMPANQLAKCSEALGLRKGFPNELSGLYTSDEMGQSENVIDITPQPAPAIISEPVQVATPKAKAKATNAKSDPWPAKSGPLYDWVQSVRAVDGGYYDNQYQLVNAVGGAGAWLNNKDEREAKLSEAIDRIEGRKAEKATEQAPPLFEDVDEIAF